MVFRVRSIESLLAHRKNPPQNTDGVFTWGEMAGVGVIGSNDEQMQSTVLSPQTPPSVVTHFALHGDFPFN